jgi:LysM repeat protein
MRENQNWRRGIVQAAISLILGLVTACVAEPTTPVSSNGDSSPVVPNVESSIVAGAPAASVQHKPRYIIIAHGQTLDRIARHNHVSPAALAAANQLDPPYKLKAGSQLLVPDSELPADHQTHMSSAAPLVAPQTPVPTPASPKAESAVPIAAPMPPPTPAAIEPTQPTQPTSSGAPAVLPPRYAPAALPLPGEVVGSQR